MLFAIQLWGMNPLLELNGHLLDKCRKAQLRPAGSQKAKRGGGGGNVNLKPGADKLFALSALTTVQVYRVRFCLFSVEIPDTFFITKISHFSTFMLVLQSPQTLPLLMHRLTQVAAQNI